MRTFFATPERNRAGVAVAAAALLALAACGSPAGSGGATSTTAAAASTMITIADAVEAAEASAGASTLPLEPATTVADHDDPEDHEWDAAAEVPIVLEGDSIDAAASGVRVDGAVATILAAGSYRISGSLENGRIVVDADGDGLVRLVLDGADITDLDGAPIEVVDADEIVVYLAEGTENRLTDGPPATAAGEDQPNAALFSRSDLTIDGSGSLIVTGTVEDGITSKDGLVITGGTIVVDAVDEGIRGKDYLVVEDGNLSVTAGGDGLKADDETDPGSVTIVGGTIEVEAGGDAISAAATVTVAGGVLDLTAGGGSEASLSGDASAKGIKGQAGVLIAGGDISIDAADDAVHSNDTVTVAGGAIEAATGDDGIHADATLEIAGGALTITRSYEGIESATITIDGGDISIQSSDDGINISSGNDGSGGMGPGRNRPGDTFASWGDNALYLNGGTVIVVAGGDGIDANGTIEMTGGTVVVHGPTANNNGALDYMGTFDVSGGLLIATGSAGMAQAPSASSSQASMSFTIDGMIEGGTVIHVETGDGTGILTFEPSKAYQAVVFSSPEVAAGATYTVYLGGSGTGQEIGGLYAADAYEPGSEAGTITVR